MSAVTVAGACNPPMGDSQDAACWGPGRGDGGQCATSFEHEPNDSTSQANALAPASCQAQTFQGSLANDVDVFRTSGSRCKSVASATASFSTDVGLRLCLFVTCTTGRTGTPPGSCPESGTDPTFLAEGIRGCCRTGSGPVTVNANCDADSNTVPLVMKPSPIDTYFVVDRPPGLPVASACSAYSVTYHY